MKKIFFFLFLFSFGYTHASIIYVNNSAVGLNNGTSWANAYTDLEMAMLFAVSGDEVWVAKGTYYTSSINDRSSSFVLNNGVKLYGNFFGNETNISQRIDLIPNSLGSDRTNETILSGDIGVLNDSTDNANHVIYVINNTLPIIIDGVKVTKGNAILTTGKGRGAGIYIENCGSVTLSNVIAINNTGTAGPDGRGAGIYAENVTSFVLEHSSVISNRIIDDPLVPGNAVYHGGGIYINSPQNDITNVYIENNKLISSRSNSEGGGLYIENNLNLNITNTTIKSNLISSTTNSTSKYLRGGGMSCYGLSSSVSVLSQNDISLNNISAPRAYTYGAGSFIYSDTLRITDCFNNDNQTNNTTTLVLTNQGGGMHANIAKMASITNSTFNNNKIYARHGYGGGLYLISASDTATITDCQFSGNRLQSSVYFDGSVMGGGLYTTCKTKISNSDFNNNIVTLSSYSASTAGAGSAAYGGGIATFSFAQILNCTMDNK